MTPISRDETKDLLAYISRTDQRFIRPSRDVVDDWWARLGVWKITEAEANAVVYAYYDRAQDRPIDKGTVIDAVRRRRNDNLARAAATPALPPGVPGDAIEAPQRADGRVDGPNARGRAIRAAYNVDGAINHPCPHCDAPAGETCHTGDGRELKIAHTARYGEAHRATHTPQPRTAA